MYGTENKTPGLCYLTGKLEALKAFSGLFRGENAERACGRLDSNCLVCFDGGDNAAVGADEAEKLIKAITGQGECLGFYTMKALKNFDFARILPGTEAAFPPSELMDIYYPVHGFVPGKPCLPVKISGREWALDIGTDAQGQVCSLNFERRELFELERLTELVCLRALDADMREIPGSRCLLCNALPGLEISGESIYIGRDKWRQTADIWRQMCCEAVKAVDGQGRNIGQILQCRSPEALAAEALLEWSGRFESSASGFLLCAEILK